MPRPKIKKLFADTKFLFGFAIGFLAVSLFANLALWQRNVNLEKEMVWRSQYIEQLQNRVYWLEKLAGKYDYLEVFTKQGENIGLWYLVAESKEQWENGQAPLLFQSQSASDTIQFAINMVAYNGTLALAETVYLDTYNYLCLKGITIQLKD